MRKSQKLKERQEQWVENSPRKAFLAAMGLLYVVYGVSWLAFPSEQNRDAIAWVPPHVSVGLVGASWVFTGLIAIVCSVDHSKHLRHRNIQFERIGFIALQINALLLAIHYAVSQLVAWLPPETDGGASGGLFKMWSYLAITMSCWFMSRSRTPQDCKVQAEHQVVSEFTQSMAIVEQDNEDDGEVIDSGGGNEQP